MDSQTIIPQLERLPQQIKKHPNWALCKLEWDDRKKKFRKLPYQLNGYRASSKNVLTWCDHDHAISTYQKNNNYASIGLVLDKNGLVCVDFDNCIDEFGQISSVVKEIVDRLDSYTEISISGSGLHVFVLGELPGKGIAHKSNDLDIEIYDSGRFMVVTGVTIDDCPPGGIKPGGKYLQELYKTYSKSNQKEYNLDWKFDPNAEIVKLDDMPVTKRWKNYIRDGSDESLDEKYEGDRSAALLGVCTELVRKGVNIESILCCLTNEKYYLGQTARDRRPDSRKSAMYWLWEYTLKKVISEKMEADKILDEEFLDLSDPEVILQKDDNDYHSKPEKVDESTGLENQAYGSDQLDLDEELGIESSNNILVKFNKRTNYSINPKRAQLNSIIYRNRNPTRIENGNPYQFNGKYWESLTMDALAASIARDMAFDGDQVKKQNVAGTVRDTITWTKLLSESTAVAGAAISGTAAADLVCLDNTVVDVTDKHNPQFKSHSVNNLVYGCTGYNYDPIGDCPRFLEFLDCQFGNDPDSITLLQEWFGYCLTSDYRFQKCMVLQGVPRSGKSMVMRILTAMVGSNDSVPMTPEAVASPHGTSVIGNKKLLNFADIRKIRRECVEKFIEVILNITGGDPILVNPKNKTPYRQTVLSKITITCNELPTMLDDNDALLSRMLTMWFPVSFEGREDPNLEPRIMLELPGIFNWALDGLSRLYQNNVFIVPESSIATKKLLTMKQNPVRYFAGEFIDHTNRNEDREYRADVYKAYCKYCDAVGIRHIHQFRFSQLFGKYLKDYNPNLKYKKTKSDPRKCYPGIKILSDKVAEFHRDYADCVDDEFDHILD